MEKDTTSLENLQDKEEVFQGAQPVGDESNEMHAQPKKMRHHNSE